MFIKNRQKFVRACIPNLVLQKRSNAHASHAPKRLANAFPPHLPQITLLPPKNPPNIRKLNRLDKIHIHARLTRILLILRTRQPRKRHNSAPCQSRFLLVRADLPRTRQAIHDRHRQVHEHEIEGADRRVGGGGFGFECFERFETVGGFEVAQGLALCEDDEEF